MFSHVSKQIGLGALLKRKRCRLAPWDISEGPSKDRRSKHFNSLLSTGHEHVQQEPMP